MQRTIGIALIALILVVNLESASAANRRGVYWICGATLAASALVWQMTAAPQPPPPAAAPARPSAKAKELVISEDALRITHVPQSHWRNEVGEMPRDRQTQFMMKIMASQVQVMKTLVALDGDPETLLFLEGAYFDATPEVREQLLANPEKGRIELGLTDPRLQAKAEKHLRTLLKNAKEAFPSGWEVPAPDKPEQGRVQLGCFALFDTAWVMWVLGEIDVIHRTSDEAFALRDEEMQRRYEAGDRSEELDRFVTLEREFEALRQVTRRLTTEKKKKAYLIFGGDHDFTQFRTEALDIKIKR